MLGEVALKAIEEKKDLFEKLAKDLWDHPETAFNEVYACKRTAEVAKELGFTVKTGAYDMPTCVDARWGDGGPKIGYLGELDALPGLSQKVSTQKEPVKLGDPGQGCGHNLLCVAPLAAAYGTMMELKASGKKGTVVYYGSPAEEVLTGKGFMARGGAFKELDVALAWHGGGRNAAGYGKMTGLNSAIFHFHGRTAHAGGDPHNGRSALDAVELMNVGANYLREHVTSDVRIHYIITEGGTAPNIVPDRAATWYYVRAMSREAVEDTYERLCDIARGAAQMTGTTVEIEYLGGCYDTLPNKVMVDIANEALHEIGTPKWSDEELKFASDMNKNSPIYNAAVHDKMPIVDTIEPVVQTYGYGSTDVGDVQHIVPCVMVTTVTTASASPGHSWMITSCAGSSIGMKGMLYGAKALALTSMKMFDDPSKIEAAKKEFDESMAGKSYKCPQTPDVPVPQPKER